MGSRAVVLLCRTPEAARASLLHPGGRGRRGLDEDRTAVLPSGA